MSKTVRSHRAMFGFVLSLVSGVIDGVIAVLFIVAGSLLERFGAFMRYRPGLGILGAGLEIVGFVGLVLAILVVVGAFLIYIPGREMVGGLLVLVFSFAGILFTWGGLFVGLVLGIVGGMLGIMKK